MCKWFHVIQEAAVCRSTLICKLVAVVLRLCEAVLGRSVEPLGDISRASQNKKTVILRQYHAIS